MERDVKRDARGLMKALMAEYVFFAEELQQGQQSPNRLIKMLKEDLMFAASTHPMLAGQVYDVFQSNGKSLSQEEQGDAHENGDKPIKRYKSARGNMTLTKNGAVTLSLPDGKGELIKLTNSESLILGTLLQDPKAVWSAQALFALSKSNGSDTMIKTHISNIRAACAPIIDIHTISGVGYTLTSNSEFFCDYLIHRTGIQEGSIPQTAHAYEYADLVLFADRNLAGLLGKKHKTPIDLTRTETKYLELLMSDPTSVFSLDALMASAKKPVQYGYEVTDINVAKSHIAKIRQKLNAVREIEEEEYQFTIHTIQGLGYSLTPSESRKHRVYHNISVEDAKNINRNLQLQTTMVS